MAVQQSAAQKAAMQAQQNNQFMRKSILQPIAANAQNGTTYATGTPMNFDVPIVAGAFVERVRVSYSLSFTYTANGTGPYVNWTAAAPYNIFSENSITFGNRQVTMTPYLTKVLAQLRGYNRTTPGQVLGSSSSNVQTALYAQPAISAGSNTIKGYYDIPLNSIHPLSVIGLLPIGGSGTRMQVQLVPATSFAQANADPLQYPISTNGTISAVTGTISVTILYRDYKSFNSPQALQPLLDGLPTAQIIKLPEINPLTSGSYNYFRFTNPYPFNKVISLVIDGQATGTFCSAANITGFRIDAAENTNSALRVWDTSSGGFNNYLINVRDRYGQDLDDGVLVFDANGENTADSSLQEGENWMNISPSGYPAARVGVQVTTVSSTNFVPRVAAWGILMNPVGIN